MGRVLLLGLLFAALGPAQPPRPYFPWWETPVTRKLDLSQEQREKIRDILSTYRERMIDQRAEVEKAELAMEEIFAEGSVEEERVDAAIERLVAARADITRSITRMGLELRQVLTDQQWQKLQSAEFRRPDFRRRRRLPRPRGGDAADQPPPPPPGDSSHF